MRLTLLCGAVACSTTHGVRPIGKGAIGVDASLGGPITEVAGASIPLPLTTIGATWGAGERTNVHAAIHPTAIGMFGVFAADVGASYQLLPQAGARPRLMADLTLVFAGGDAAPGGQEGGFRLFAQPSATMSWDWGRARRQTVYAGLTAFTEPLPEPHALAAFYAGNRFGLGARFHATAELKWIAPYASSLDVVPEYLSPGMQGAVSFQLGLGYRFGGVE